MRFPDSKNVVFVQILLRPTLHCKNLATLIFQYLELDVIEIKLKLHIWVWETSYINALNLISHELFDLYLKLI